MKHMFTTGVAALALTVAGAMANAADVTLNLSNEYSATSIHGVGDARFASLVAEKTGGSVEVVVHYGGALGYKSADHFDAVGEGALEIADTYGGALGGIDPLFLISSLPFFVTTVDEAELLYKVAEPEFKKVFEENDQILLYASPWPPSGIWAREAKDSTAALSGLKIRTYDKNGTTALNELGAAAVRLSWADVVPSISTGAIDAVLTSAEGGVSGSFWEHFDTFTEIYNYAIPLNFVHISKDVFDGLSEEQQAAVLEAAAETRDLNWAAIPDRLNTTYGQLAENNVTVVTSDDAAYRDALQAAGEAALKDWLESTGDRGQALIDAFNSAKSQ
ncbi:MAG: TRAP transporter substrate-binding protein [Sediminimonas qiaohouensis]|uniref:TRAP transporter substrate-binding protein n=1 Tax=Sediminimonas qiaohouensis TaxID=552061 RepID=A0A7C9LNJ5_9RHOB|nr:TRAP transporter substrate-binding protein [Sediminimonas qiaohouensis]MTJ04540.1 TRAP transporter substrate-binding protein [Sediminimonas qiaohouensis]